MRLVFMGTPEFAVPSLRKLIESSHPVAGVVTQPDRPSGRGLQVSTSPVKRFALEAELPLVQPADLKDKGFHLRLKEWNADCFVVVAFRILPQEVFDLPPKGTVNLHASLLPRYRGAAPIQWAILRGETETGVTTFFIDRKVDTGDWILQEKTSIDPDETAGELHDRLARIGADCLLKTIDLIAEGKAVRNRQQGGATAAPKILPEHCRIDWGRPAAEVVNFIRGLSPHPGAYTVWNGKRVKLFKAGSLSGEYTGAAPGTVVRADEAGLTIASGSGRVIVRMIQLECGQAMAVGDFLRGHCIVSGTVLGATLPA
jgi:methionyl-tRNA formyltransferase